MFIEKSPIKTYGYKIPQPDEQLQQILIELVQKFKRKYKRKKPKNVIDFVLNFFESKREEREQAFYLAEPEPEPETITFSDFRKSEETKIEEMATYPSITPPPRVRRKSVFAETMDPEDYQETTDVIYPKTDQQRIILNQCIKKILIFRALDEQQQMEVLDAMFEKQVYAGDVIIRQGDDGDNFYIIESGKPFLPIILNSYCRRSQTTSILIITNIFLFKFINLLI